MGEVLRLELLLLQGGRQNGERLRCPAVNLRVEPHNHTPGKRGPQTRLHRLPTCDTGWKMRLSGSSTALGAEKLQCQSYIIYGIYELQFNPRPLRNTNTSQGF
ncbi:hypothetical protein EYF80_002721 [Liparis tanakae]|uniref:Uncharacterized protein n=1 Tax=Liparis tanakae TaxID=230148 RepID=A0A4Z2J9R5_9TELE|nr:hypothetical protein EYF80_002721 [Liparis tanakae]